MLSAAQALLQQGIEQLGLQLSAQQQQQLMAYLALFAKWNRAYNLSAIRDLEQMVRLHLLDSLAIVPHISGERLIDVGTGGGLPGIPLAICYPHRSIALLDSAGKKTRFLFQVKTDLSLANVQIHNCRVEAHTPADKYDGVVSRAFASLADMTQSCEHLLKSGGTFWAMKGVYPAAELAALAPHIQLRQSIALTVPGLAAERCLLALTASNET
ncbi:MAG: 16S rRNA (guanine(527)-N(7))-methyltransferase RsmG [Marinagarivorans sp.]